MVEKRYLTSYVRYVYIPQDDILYRLKQDTHCIQARNSESRICSGFQQSRVCEVACSSVKLSVRSEKGSA